MPKTRTLISPATRRIPVFWQLNGLRTHNHLGTLQSSPASKDLHYQCAFFKLGNKLILYISSCYYRSQFCSHLPFNVRVYCRLQWGDTSEDMSQDPLFQPPKPAWEYPNVHYSPNPNSHSAPPSNRPTVPEVSAAEYRWRLPAPKPRVHDVEGVAWSQTSCYSFESESWISATAPDHSITHTNEKSIRIRHPICQIVVDPTDALQPPPRYAKSDRRLEEGRADSRPLPCSRRMYRVRGKLMFEAAEWMGWMSWKSRMRMFDENGLALTTLRTDARTDLATTKLYRNVTTITPHSTRPKWFLLWYMSCCSTPWCALCVLISRVQGLSFWVCFTPIQALRSTQFMLPRERILTASWVDMGLFLEFSKIIIESNRPDFVFRSLPHFGLDV